MDQNAEYDAQEETYDASEPEFEPDASEEHAEEESETHEESDEEEERYERRRDVPIKTRINQTNREKFQALEIARQFQQENEQLKRLVSDYSARIEESGNAAMMHYEDSVKLKLEKARNAKERAIEEGDVRAQMEAEEAYTKAVLQEQEINSSKARQIMEHQRQQRYQQEQQYTQQYQQEQYQEPEYYEEHETESEEWIEANPWFNPQSEEYNPRLSKEVTKYSDAFEANLINGGQAHMIGSPEYFEMISEYTRKLLQENDRPSQRRELPMKQSRYGVFPAKSSPSAQQRATQTRRVQMTADEVDMARRLGVTNEQYISSRNIERK